MFRTWIVVQVEHGPADCYFQIPRCLILAILTALARRTEHSHSTPHFCIATMITQEVVISLAICIAAAILEGALTGGRIKERLAELRVPAYSPPFTLWIVIGVAYYLICLLLTVRLLTIKLTAWPSIAAFSLLMTIMIANGVWGNLFFRMKSPRMSSLFLIPYSACVLLLFRLLWSVDPFSAAILIPYLVYLPYVIRWNYQVARINAAREIR
jgi:translocator protein